MLIVPSSGSSVGSLNKEAGDGHRGEQGAGAEQEKVEQVLVASGDAFLVPVGRGYPQNEAQGGCGRDRVVGLSDAGANVARGEFH